MGSPQFRLLGPLEIEGGAVRGPKQRALLGRLLLGANETISRERLIDELWPEQPPETAAHAIQVYVSQLRKALPPSARIVTAGTAYRLEVDEEEVDALRFRRLVARGRRSLHDGDPHGAVETLREAERLWRGAVEAVPAASAAAELEELRLAALEDRVEAELAAGGHADLVPELEALAREHPHRERFRRQLMLALYRCDRQADALAAYREGRRASIEELGLEPGPQLRELQQAILRQDPALAGAPARLRRLPTPRTPLIGRRRELEELIELCVGGARLVTLTGPGGAGKTRLALELGGRLEHAFPDGVAFVELAGVTDPSLVLAEIARAVGAEEGASLAHRLRELELLLILDNFEHVDEAAPELRALLETGALTVVVTSRRPLRLYGEHEYAVGSLAPGDAVDLFVARARAVNAALRETPALRELCKRLDRLPLAIELVAARSRDLPVAELLESLPTPLDAAVAGPRDVPERHRTLRAAIEWSYTLLDDVERRAFVRLAVFAGSFSAPSAAAVAGVPRDVLASLASQSLLLREDERYGFLETIREYARERLRAEGGADAAMRRHADHFASLAAEGTAIRMSEAEIEWMDRLEPERDDLREALAWLLERDVEQAAALVIDLFRFWYIRLHLEEARRAYENVWERAAGLPAATRAQLLRYSAAFAFARREVTDAIELAEAALALDRERGDQAAAARTLVMLGTAYGEAGDAEHALELLEESVAIAQAATDRRLLSFTTAHLALAVLSARDDERAAEVSREAIDLLHEVGDAVGEAGARGNLALALLRLGRPVEALAEFELSLDLARQVRDTALILSAIEGVAAVESRQGRAEESARLLGATAAAAESRELTLELLTRSLREETLALLREAIGGEAVESALAAGRALSADEAADAASAIAKNLRTEGGITASDLADAPKQQ